MTTHNCNVCGKITWNYVQEEKRRFAYVCLDCDWWALNILAPAVYPTLDKFQTQYGM